MARSVLVEVLLHLGGCPEFLLTQGSQASESIGKKGSYDAEFVADSLSRGDRTAPLRGGREDCLEYQGSLGCPVIKVNEKEQHPDPGRTGNGLVQQYPTGGPPSFYNMRCLTIYSGARAMLDPPWGLPL